MNSKAKKREEEKVKKDIKKVAIEKEKNKVSRGELMLLDDEK